jgi:pilus assembly protein CpaF
MFGKRSADASSPVARLPASVPAQTVPVLTEPDARPRVEPRADPVVPISVEVRKSEEYYQTKGMILGALIEAIDLSQLARLDAESARDEIRDIVNEIIAIKNVVMSIAENCSTTSATTSSATGRSSRSSRATTSPTSW